MRAVVQRVSRAKVTAGDYCNAIGRGLMVLVAFEDEDTDADLQWMARKLSAMRIFDDEQGVMNLSVSDVDGEVLVVSQFTLYALTARGNRPSYIKASKPDVAIPLYEKFLNMMSACMQKDVKKGIFGADMQVELVNDGPVTIVIDSKKQI